jgi:hypothetical protein
MYAQEIVSPYCLRAWHVFIVQKRDWKLWACFLSREVGFRERDES